MTEKVKSRMVACKPYDDQRPGTAGLRKTVRTFRQPHYLETYLQAIFSTLEFAPGATLIVGGDGRYMNQEAVQVIARMAAAHGIGKLITGLDGQLSTPAASLLIRRHGAAGGFLLTASHNPGGPDGDFGIKFNTHTGGQAPEALSEQIFAASREVSEYRIAELPDFDLARTGLVEFEGFAVEVVDSTRDYADLMETLFDFDRMRDWLSGSGRICFDSLHAVTGPYAEEILIRRLGAPAASVMHANPLPDFGGFHPDPNPVDAAHLIELSASDVSPDLIAASDGDGDRNMICGPGVMVSPGDSIAVMLEHAGRLPGYRTGVPGVARSMPTSRAVDLVAEAHGIPCFETPTGWRFFCNLLEAGRISLCGEESFGTGSNHVREKDGLWAVLFWLNLLAELRQSVPEILARHWRQYGRHYYQRHDYFIADRDRADALIDALRGRLDSLPGTQAAGSRIESADDFHYVDPVDNSESRHQGVCLTFDDGSRVVYRLSGTGTSGATLRVYLEQYTPPDGDHYQALAGALQQPAARAAEIAGIEKHTGLHGPTAVI
jgi:phosphoglucomutase